MKDKAYWIKRAEQTILESERSVIDYESRLRDIYNVALLNIQKEIDAFFNKYARDNKIPYAEVRRRLTAVEMKPFEAQVKEWYRLSQQLNLSPEYAKYLKELSAKTYVSRLQSLEGSIRFEIERLATEKITGVTELMATNYLSAYYSSYYNLASGMELAVNFSTIDKLGIDTAVNTRWDGRNYSDNIWKDKVKLVATMEKILPQSFSRGLNSVKLGEMLAKELKVSKNNGVALARTEVNYMCGQATLKTYDSANIAEYDYLATLDMRTSEICRDLDGRRFKVSQASVGVNYPPMHVRCRSTTIPVVDDEFDEPIERIAKDEDSRNIKVPRNMSQEEWIKKYVPENQQAGLLKFKGKYQSE